MTLRWPVAAAVLLAACARTTRRAAVAGAHDVGAACPWQWAAPETLLYRGAPFSLDASVVARRDTLLLIGGRANVSADSDVAPGRLLGFTVDPRGVVDTLMKPTFMPPTYGTNVWAAAGAGGTTHVAWDALSPRGLTLSYASLEHGRWSRPDSLFGAAMELLLDQHVLHADGDDVVVARPATDSGFSGIAVAVRSRGAWDVSRLEVRHHPLHELSFAAAVDDGGAALVYARPGSQNAGNDSTAGVYVRRRPFGGAWGPETPIWRGEGAYLIPLETDDGTIHILWRGYIADSNTLFDATSRDWRRWHVDRRALPHDIQHVSAAVEDDAVRVVLLAADDPNDIDMTYSRLLTFAWRPGGAGATDTLRLTQPVGSPEITHISADTNVLTWDGQRLVRRRGYESLVPVTLLARRVKTCDTLLSRGAE